jgi:hypothetical protein
MKKKLKDIIINKAEGHCYYCYATERLYVDRVDRNQPDTENNLRLCCLRCGAIKRRSGHDIEKLREKLFEAEEASFLRKALAVSDGSVVDPLRQSERFQILKIIARLNREAAAFRFIGERDR